MIDRFLRTSHIAAFDSLGIQSDMQFNNERLIGGSTTDGSQSVSVHLMVFNHFFSSSFYLFVHTLFIS